ncbi:DUF3422 domain-containing protein [Nitrosomonas sp. JL21]|uniref:DUF3422 family protein n=1 Tax=Nitrosomonas sp. JL21 TaxID=153949 RepID=UPI00136B07C7|nr:DUF3422 domain-containing protein [Nitrosomonas sp. JL21]MBL8498358.1 DUF3422 domain-containing protein [Nitrosomonas sp.]MCC7091819.1 DUF3422 domain-containing protein [Nitrosomonas sp.]MXS77574.1 DUF3422 domain-containing protein [Nitrosomonas sp. JL21]
MDVRTLFSASSAEQQFSQQPSLRVPEYPERVELHTELNSVAYELLTPPFQLSHLVLMSERDRVEQERQLVGELCAHYSVDPPSAHESDFSADFGEFRLRWERHTEYSTYTVYRAKAFEVPFEHPAIDDVPAEWVARLPGELLVATHIALEDRSRPKRSLHELVTLFASGTVIGSKVAGGAASVWSDNQIHKDNFGRILIHDENLRSRQVGRLVQRLLEIETYRMLAMLPLPITRRIIPQLARADQRLAALIASNVETNSIEDEQHLLEELTRLAAETERMSAQTSHRFNASRAYYDIVKLRITELREERIEGLQMLQEFMIQRLSSAMGTCELVHTKLETLSTRLGRASALLRTRVDLSMEAQIRDLLKSMDNRAHVQLRMQETVEGLSVVVLSYYLLGILGYGLKALKAAGYDLDVELVTGMAIPVIVLSVFFVVTGLRHIFRKLHPD